MKENSFIIRLNKFQYDLLNFIFKNKKKSFLIVLFVFYLFGVFFIVWLTIHRYLHTESKIIFALLLFRSVVYFVLYSIFFLSIWLSTVKINLEKKFVVFASLFGICYMFVMTPCSIPDEYSNYRSSYLLSNKIMLNMSEYGLVSQLDISPYSIVGHENIPGAYISVFENIFKGNLFSQTNELREIVKEKRQFREYFAQNLPQAIGITAARLIGGNFLLLFYSARFFNLVFYLICGYFAIKKLSQINTNFSYTMLLIMLMPMALHQAGSVSYDTFGNGVAFLLTVSFISAIFDEQQLSKADFICMFIYSVLLAPFKLVYFPLCFLCLLIPKEKFKNKKYNNLYKISIITCSLLFFIIFQIKTLKNVSSGVNWDVYTFDYIFHNPFQTIKIIIDTINVQFSHYFLGAIGTNMSGETLPIPTYISLTLFVVLLFSTISEKDDILILSIKQRIVSLVIFLSVCFLMLIGEMIHWTSFGSKLIYGIQPRYFIPIFPLFFIMFKNKVFLCTKEINTFLLEISVLLQCITLAYIVQITIEKYFLINN